MAIQNTILNFPNINISAQVRDIIYYTPFNGGSQGGFNQAGLANTIMLGPIVNITKLGDETIDITVEYDDALTSAPAQGDFISFAKDKIELFSVGSDIKESSK